MTDIVLLFYALSGGIAINVLRLGELNGKPKSERDILLKDPLYWIQFFFIPFMGGVLASAYINSGINMNPILAIQIGASAPLILKTFAHVIPTSIKDVL